jgi:DNA-directed RNA polymerase specialized sigma subunit
MKNYDHDLNDAVLEFQSLHQQYLARLLSIEYSQAWISDWAKKRIELAQENSTDTKSLKDLINLLDGKPKLSRTKLSNALETLSYDYYFHLIAQMGSRPEASEAETARLEKRLETLSIEILDKCEPLAKRIAAKVSARFRREPGSFKSLFFLSLLRAVHQWRSGQGEFITYYAVVVRNALVNDEYRQLLIRIRRHDIPDVRRLLDETIKFERAKGRQPTNEELAVALNLSTERTLTLKAQIYSLVSLDAPLSEDPNAGTLYEVISSDLAPNDKAPKVEAAIRSCLTKLLASAGSPQPDDDRLPFEVKQDFGLILLTLPAELCPVLIRRSRTGNEALVKLIEIGFKDLKQCLADEKK